LELNEVNISSCAQISRLGN